MNWLNEHLIPIRSLKPIEDITIVHTQPYAPAYLEIDPEQFKVTINAFGGISGGGNLELRINYDPPPGASHASYDYEPLPNKHIITTTITMPELPNRAIGNPTYLGSLLHELDHARRLDFDNPQISAITANTHRYPDEKPDIYITQIPNCPPSAIQLTTRIINLAARIDNKIQPYIAPPDVYSYPFIQFAEQITDHGYRFHPAEQLADRFARDHIDAFRPHFRLIHK